MHFREYGNGHPLVLLHGFCESHKIWHHLATHDLPGHRIICPDLPGFGATPLLTKTTIEEVAAQVISLTNELGLDSFVLGGHSLGGYVSLAIAEQFPEKLRGLMLIHSTAQPDSEEKKENRLKSLEFIRKHGVKSFIDTFVSGLFYAERRDLFLSEISELEIEAGELPFAVLEAYTLAMRMRKSRMNVLKNTTVPKLFVAGKYDMAVPLENSESHKEVLKADEWHLLEQSAHMGMIEEREKLSSLLNDFLQKVKPTF